MGSVASAIGIYGMSLLYLWSGSLDLEILRQSWLSMDGIDHHDLWHRYDVVAFGFKVSHDPIPPRQLPMHTLVQLSQVSGLLATASKAMGFLALFRVLVMITVPDGSEAIWMIALGIFAIVTMTWGNLAALTSENPKRMLAYSVWLMRDTYASIAVVGSGISSVDQNGNHPNCCFHSICSF